MADRESSITWALFHQVGNTLTYKSAVQIGDRLQLIGAAAKVDTAVKADQPTSPMSSGLGYILTVNYLDRKNGEALTVTPTVAKSVALRVKNHVVTR